MDSRTTPIPASEEAGISRFAARIRAQAGWRRSGIALGAGALSILAMPPFLLWPVLLVTIPILACLIDGADPCPGANPTTTLARRMLIAAIPGFMFAYAFHVLGLYWLREAFLVTGGRLGMLWPLGVLGLPAFLALFHALAAALAVVLAPRGPWRIAALAVTLGATEWLRGNILTGFPWNVLGTAITGTEVLMQSAGLLGIYGLTVVTVLMTGLPALLLAEARYSPSPRAARAAAAAALVVPLGALAAYGLLRLSTPDPGWAEGVRLRLVQPAIDQREKWLASKQMEFVERHIELSLKDPTGRRDDLAGITHVIWPEAAMPFVPLQRPEVLSRLGEALPDGVHLLAGILRLDQQRITPSAANDTSEMRERAYNSLAVFDHTGRPIHIYDKSHLVPFGEYLPLQGFLEKIGLSALTRQRGGFSLGPEPRPVLSIPGLAAAAPLICYEAIFPRSSAKSTVHPRLLVNVTNDGWFGNSTGPRQHLHQARLRSVEDGVPLLRVANNGITAVYDGLGRELARLDMNVAGVIDTRLPQPVPAPAYARFGDLLFLLICVIVLFTRFIFTLITKP